MAIKVSKQLNDALKEYKHVIMNTFNTEGSSKSYCTYLRSIENEMREAEPEPSFTLLDDWILPQLKIKDKTITGNEDESDDVDISWDLLGNVLKKFDDAFGHITHIRTHPKHKCRSALASFTKYILGQYKANIYLSLELTSDLDYCRIVARNALFCTFDVAEAIKKGESGSELNQNQGGNDYFSWYCCFYQRKSTKDKEQIGAEIEIKQEEDNTQHIGKYKLDSNNYASLAIKYAVLAGSPLWQNAKYNDFEGYMACHIWDKSCYDYRYHTSVFNLVLLPKSIGGLTDYNDTVKELLQYEAAMRFGVYPKGKNPDDIPYKYEMSKKTKRIYKIINNDWRQPGEHKRAMENEKNKNFKPEAI